MAARPPAVSRQPSWRAERDKELREFQKVSIADIELAEAAAQDAPPTPPGLGLVGHLQWTFLVSLVPCAIITGMWSQIGAGEAVFHWLEKQHAGSGAVSGILAACLLGLYLADFFWPPHLPGQYLVLFDRDKTVGRMITAALGVLVFWLGLMSCRNSPAIPLVLTLLLGPATLAAVRSMTAPQPPNVPKGTQGVTNVLQRMAILQSFTGSAMETRRFYLASTISFATSGVAWIIVFAAWCAKNKMDTVAPTDDESAIKYYTFIAPALAGFGNLAFSLILSMRLRLGGSYDQTMQAEARLALCRTKKERLLLRNLEMHFAAAGRTEEIQKLGGTSAIIEDYEAYAEARLEHLRQLANIIKVVGCIVMVMMCTFYAAFQMVSIDGGVSGLILGFLFVFLVTFCLFIFIAFRRMMGVMLDWITEMPVWGMLMEVLHSDIVRAAVVCGVLPLSPFIFLLSMLNQAIRRYRGLYARVPPGGGRKPPPRPPKEIQTFVRPSHKSVTGEAAEAGEGIALFWAPGDSWFTERVTHQLESMNHWDWVSIVEKVYIVGLGFAAYTVCPRVMNVVLAFLVGVLSKLPFAAIIVATFVSGFITMITPPGPVMPAYLFAGIVLAGTCPNGFWIGAFTACVLTFVLRATVCLCQVVCIGGILGRSPAVKAQCGVHKPLIRAIEIILKRRLSIGKLAIICGGPDWPTSVLAGLIGVNPITYIACTLPTVFFSSPATMCGSFYLKYGEGGMWKRTALLMLQWTVIGGGCLQLVAAWVIQDVLEKQHNDVTKPLEQYADLDWVDYHSEQVHHACFVPWGRIPVCARVIFVIGMLIEVSAAQLFYWKATVCFGEFAVTDKISDLVVYGEEGLIKPGGLAGLAMNCVGLVCFLVVGCVLKSIRKPAKEARLAELAAMEQDWKHARVSLARDAQKDWPLPDVPKRGGIATE